MGSGFGLLYCGLCLSWHLLQNYKETRKIIWNIRKFGSKKEQALGDCNCLYLVASKYIVAD